MSRFEVALAAVALASMAPVGCSSRSSDGSPAGPAGSASAAIGSAAPPAGSVVAVDSGAAPAGSARPDRAGASFSSPPPVYRPPADGSRLGALGWETPVRERPSDKAKVLGYLRAGSVVRAGAAPVGRDGCSAGWYQVEPDGYVCADPSNATTDMTSEVLRAFTRRPDTSARMPYAYGIVRRGGPVFGRLPTLAQAEAAEPGLEGRMKEWLAAPGEDGPGFRAEHWVQGRTAPDAAALWSAHTTAEVPWFLADGRAPPVNLSGYPPASAEGIVLARTKHHNGFAFVDSAVSEGRRYAISTQLFLVPVDRLRPIEGSNYRGVEIPGDISFPFALVRRAGPLMKLEGKKLVRERDVERRAALKLSGKQRKFGDRLYFETADGLWISDQHASRLDPAKKMPKWGKQGERWLDVNISKQTLVAYDGTRAVYATLVSTGEAGLGDPESSKSTKRGIFRVHAKHLTATMDSDVVGEEFELRDIPYVQYFEGGYALHAAYWHDDFGTPRSHGCINLAPEDARRLFFFTEPALPDGWHGVRRALTGSVVFVHP